MRRISFLIIILMALTNRAQSEEWSFIKEPDALAQMDKNGYPLRMGGELKGASLRLSANSESCSLNDCPWEYSLEIELRPADESFTGNATHSSMQISRDKENCAQIEYGPIKVAGLVPGTAYKWQARQKVVTYNAFNKGKALSCINPKTYYSPWKSHGDTYSPSFVTAALVINVTKDPISVVKLEGRSADGGANRLNMDDERYYRVWTTTGAPYQTSWYALFNGIEKGRRNLKISYQGFNSQPCYQSIHIWDWSLEEWIEMDSQEVGEEEVLIEDLEPPGDISSYISSTGRGELKVRVFCSSDLLSFSANGNFLKISYDKPVLNY